MGQKMLEEIVTDPKEQKFIRPLFEQATAAGNVSFEHDWQWNAYCDLLCAIVSFETDMTGEYRRASNHIIERDAWGYDLKLLRKVDLVRAELKKIVSKIPQIVLSLEEYNSEIGLLLQRTFSSRKGGEKYIVSIIGKTERDFVTNIQARIRYANTHNTKMIQLSNELKRGGILFSLPDLSDEEVEVLRVFLKNREPNRKKKRVLELLAVSADNTYSDSPPCNVREAIECASVSIPNLTVVRKIGAGDFKVTYAAIHDVLEERVALKILRPEERTLEKSSVRRGLYTLADKREYTGIARKQRALVRSFKEEAQALTKVSHPHVAKFLGAGLEPRMYLIEEYIKGRTLLDIALDPRERNKENYTERVSKYLYQIYSALQYIHEHFHIIHLDVKPSNIIIRTDDEAILTDFGCSHVLDQAPDSPTYNLARLYKPISRIMKYPEIMESGLVGTCVDEWQWGITAYMVLFGHHPFCPDLTIDDWYSDSLSSERRDEAVRKVEKNSKKILEESGVGGQRSHHWIRDYETSAELLFGTILPKDFVRKATAFNPYLSVDTIWEGRVDATFSEKMTIGTLFATLNPTSLD